MTGKSAIGGQGSTLSNQHGVGQFGYSGRDIHSNPQVQQARDVLTIVKGEDGKPQIWSTGDQQSARDLLTQAAKVFNMDFQNA